MSFFEPLPTPPQPPARQWAPPAWDRPSEGTLPATLAVDAVLEQSEDIVVALTHLDVFGNGFRINLVVLLDPHRAQELQARAPRGPMMLMPRIGVRFADGRAGGRSAMLHRLDVPKDEQGLPTQPFVGYSGGGGGTGGWRFGAWVYPLPPDGPLEIFVALPGPNTAEVRTVVEGSAVRAAAERAKVIWS
jgi:hypothetical protein